TLVRSDDDHYRRLRPHLSLGAKDVLPLGDGVGLHPALVHVREHFLEGRVAVVEGIGLARSSLSHFRSQDVWDAGTLAHPDHGWLGRWLDQRVESERALASPVALLALGRDTAPAALASRSLPTPALPSLARVRTLASHPTAAGENGT